MALHSFWLCPFSLKSSLRGAGEGGIRGTKRKNRTVAGMRDRRGLLGVPGPNPSRPPPHPLPILPPAASPLVGSSSLCTRRLGAWIQARRSAPQKLAPHLASVLGLVLGVLGGGAASPGKPRSPRPDPRLLWLRRPSEAGRGRQKKDARERDVVEQEARLRRHLQRASKYQSVCEK